MKKKIKACGAILWAKSSRRALFLLRDADSHTNTWGLVGGKVEGCETVTQALMREISEEVQFVPEIKKLIPIELFLSKDLNFEYHTFVCVIEEEFMPVLNEEHKGYCWCDLDCAPKPLHPGLYSSLSNECIQAKLATLRTVLETI